MNAGHSYPRHDWLLRYKTLGDRHWIFNYATSRPEPPHGAVAWHIDHLTDGQWVEVTRGKVDR